MESLVQAWFKNQSHPSHHRLVCYFKCAPEVNSDDKEYLEHVYQWRLGYSPDFFSLTGWHSPSEQWKSETESDALICLLRTLVSKKGPGTLRFPDAAGNEKSTTVICHLCPDSVERTVEIVIGFTIRNQGSTFTFVSNLVGCPDTVLELPSRVMVCVTNLSGLPSKVVTEKPFDAIAQHNHGTWYVASPCTRNLKDRITQIGQIYLDASPNPWFRFHARLDQTPAVTATTRPEAPCSTCSELTPSDGVPFCAADLAPVVPRSYQEAMDTESAAQTIQLAQPELSCPGFTKRFLSIRTPRSSMMVSSEDWNIVCLVIHRHCKSLKRHPRSITCGTMLPRNVLTIDTDTDDLGCQYGIDWKSDSPEHCTCHGVYTVLIDALRVFLPLEIRFSDTTTNIYVSNEIDITNCTDMVVHCRWPCKPRSITPPRKSKQRRL